MPKNTEIGGSTRKFIFVNRYYSPDISATSQLLTDLAQHMQQRGHNVHLITGRQLYNDASVELPASERNDGIKINRIATSRFGRGKLLGRAIDYLTFHLTAARMIMRLATRADVVILATDPPLMSTTLGPLARLKGASTINWLHDLFPEVATRLGIGGSTVASPFSALLRWQRNLSLRRSGLNVVLGRRMAQCLGDLRVDKTKIRIIHNWADDLAIRPLPPTANTLRLTWGFQPDDFVIGYSGNLGRAHEIDTIIEAIKLLHANLQTNAALSIKFVFIGGGALYGKLQTLVNHLGLRDVAFQPYQPRETLIESLCVPDVHLVSLRPELEGLIVPSKFYGIAAAGRPTIFVGDTNGEIANILRDERCGISVAVGDGAGLAKAITALAGNEAERTVMGQRARQLAVSRFSKTEALSAWTAVLEKQTSG